LVASGIVKSKDPQMVLIEFSKAITELSWKSP
jgi:hypothetical protein